MLTLAAVSLCLALQAPPTMDELRRNMAEDMRKLTSYSDEWKVELPKESEGGDLAFRRYIDGPRSQLSVIFDGKSMIESGFDGKNSWVISHAVKVYADEPQPNAVYDKKADAGPPMEAENGSFQFTFSGPYDFIIWAKPDLQVKSLEKVKLGDVETRKVTAIAIKESGKMEVEMWFDLDRWRMVKARAHGGKTGEPETEVAMVMVKNNFKEKYDAGSFMLDQAKVGGYTKKSFDDIKGGGLGSGLKYP